MGKYESDADAVLEKKGVEPDDPLILLTLGDETREAVSYTHLTLPTSDLV